MKTKQKITTRIRRYTVNLHRSDNSAWDIFPACKTHFVDAIEFIREEMKGDRYDKGQIVDWQATWELTKLSAEFRDLEFDEAANRLRFAGFKAEVEERDGDLFIVAVRRGQWITELAVFIIATVIVAAILALIYFAASGFAPAADCVVWSAKPC